MEIIGDDKKLRALYSEAQHADATATPSFTSVWHRAQARSLKPRRAFNLSFALVTALLVLTLGSLAVWSMYSNRSTPPRQASTNNENPSTVVPVKEKSPQATNVGEDVKTAKAPSPIEMPANRPAKPRVRRVIAQNDRQTIASNRTSVKETTIDTWQSPTSSLLSSPTDSLFKSVPQLNENANEMKSFLQGRSNDKEK